MFSVKERAAHYGVQSLSNLEMIAHMIGANVSKFKEMKTIQDVYKKYESLKLTDLQKQKLETFFLIHERFLEEELHGNRIHSPSDVVSHMTSKLKHKMQEEFHVILLNNKNVVIKDLIITRGTLNASVVHPRDVFNAAIKELAARIILCHNHPGGSTSPSAEDCIFTERLVEAGKLLGIKVVDHIIIGGNNYYSFKEQERI